MKETCALVLFASCIAAFGGDLTVDNLAVYGMQVVTQQVDAGSVPTNGMTLHYPYSSTGNAIDESPNNLTGTVYNATWTSSGKIGGAYAFSGASNCKIEAGDTAALDISGAITLAAWIKPGTMSVSQSRGIISKWRDESPSDLNQRAYCLGFNSGTDKLFFNISSNGVLTKQLLSSQTLSADTWYHVVAVFSPSSYMKIYVNGQVDTNTTTSVPGVINNSTAPLWIAQLVAATRDYTFEGTIDECLIYDRALSGDEVGDLYQYNGSSPTAGMRIYTGIEYSAPLGDIGMGIYTNNP